MTQGVAHRDHSKGLDTKWTNGLSQPSAANPAEPWQASEK